MEWQCVWYIYSYVCMWYMELHMSRHVSVVYRATCVQTRFCGIWSYVCPDMCLWYMELHVSVVYGATCVQTCVCGIWSYMCPDMCLWYMELRVSRHVSVVYGATCVLTCVCGIWSYMCPDMCLWYLSVSMNPAPHTSHVNLKFPVWVAMWRRRPEYDWNTFLQCGHGYVSWYSIILGSFVVPKTK